MRRILRCAFAGLLSLALAASGAALAFASHLTGHANGAHHFHDTAGAIVAHAHRAHDHAAPARSDDTPQSPGDHVSKTCCSICTVASPLPPIPDTNVQLTTSRAAYASFARFDVALALSIDPGIPKRIG
jgi:hypothetical protein